MGMPGADERILTLSYPWIGYARAAIRNENVHPQSKYLPHFCVTMLFKLSLRDDSTLQILIPFLNHLKLRHLVWAHVNKIVLYYIILGAVTSPPTFGPPADCDRWNGDHMLVRVTRESQREISQHVADVFSSPQGDEQKSPGNDWLII